MSRSTLLLPVAIVLTVPLAARPQDDKVVAGKTRNEWLKVLKEDESARKREGALVILSTWEPRDRAILDAIAIALLNDKAERVRLKALDGVAAILTTAVGRETRHPLVEPFGRSMSSDQAEAVRLKATAIAKDLKKEHLKDLVTILSDVLRADKSAAVRAGAAAALGRAGEHAKSVVNAMVEAFKDPDASVRAASAEAMGRIGDDARGAIPRIIPLLKDQDAGVRLAAAFALGRVGPEANTAVPDLSLVLASDSDVAVRKEAARAFTLLGLDAKAGIPALAKALRDDKSEEVRQQCALALGKMGGDVQSAVPAMIESMQKDPDKTVRTFTVHALGNTLGSNLKNHVKELADQLLKDKDGDVRIAIIQELAALGPDAKDALPALQRAVTDVQLTVRDEAKKAVKRVTAKQ
jgi:HEAT repeat protein